jgi:hypothetical protein
MKDRFARKVEERWRHTLWDVSRQFYIVGAKASSLQLHGIERVVLTYHRVGSGSSSVFYLHRNWLEDRLCGAQIVREINSCWYRLYYPARPENSPGPAPIHPYEGVEAVESMIQWGRHFLVQPMDTIPSGWDSLGRILVTVPGDGQSYEEANQALSLAQDDEEAASSFAEIMHGRPAFR